MSKIKKGDEVIVTCGRDKGKRGKVIRSFPKIDKLLVESVNLVKKHVKPNTRTNTEGGIFTREALIHASNVAIYNPLTKKADRIGIKQLSDGRSVRYFKSNNEIIEI
jgi:large subunit ribosomal protein L24